MCLLLTTLVVAACGGGSSPSSPGDTSTGGPSTASATAGESIDIGGRSLFLKCRGSEGPTVLLEAGLTGDHRTWDGVVSELPEEARVCTYDRANVGSSDPAETPRTAQDVVDDIEAMLDAGAFEAPLVLVGFSFGGIFAQLFAAEHPDQIAGLVLVESNHPDEARQFEANLTPDQIAADRAQAQANPEGVDVYASLDQAAAAGPLPDVPLVVITATESGGWPPDWDAELFDQLRAEQQADLASRVPGGEQVFAEGSGHEVPREQPAVIVDAINRVLA